MRPFEVILITLSRLNGSVVAINPDLITWIDVTPDTTVSLLNGEKIIVRESLDEVVQRVIAFRRAIGPDAMPGYPPSAQVMQGTAWKRDALGCQDRSSQRPPTHAPASRHPSSPPPSYRK